MNSLTNQGVAFAPQIEAAARRHGLDPRLLAAVAAQETGGPGSNSGRNIVGDGGHGRGLFQIDDRWHAFARSGAALDPARNAEYAAGLLAGLVKRYGSVHQALSAYNVGNPRATGTLTTWGDGRTLGYADSVMRHYAQLGGATHPADLAAPVDGLRSAAQAAGLPQLGTPAFQPPDFTPRSFTKTGQHHTSYAGLIDIGGDSIE